MFATRLVYESWRKISKARLERAHENPGEHVLVVSPNGAVVAKGSIAMDQPDKVGVLLVAGAEGTGKPRRLLVNVQEVFVRAAVLEFSRCCGGGSPTYGDRAAGVGTPFNIISSSSRLRLVLPGAVNGNVLVTYPAYAPGGARGAVDRLTEALRERSPGEDSLDMSSVAAALAAAFDDPPSDDAELLTQQPQAADAIGASVPGDGVAEDDWDFFLRRGG